MLFSQFGNPLEFVFFVIALIIAITVHEFSHAFTADYLGDPTPRLQGRLTLNPLAHLDLVGTLMLFIARFGWGKPVQFDPFNLRKPRRDAALISIAGPISNIIVATISSIILRILLFVFLTNSLVTMIIIGLLQQIIMLNVVLAVFNLIPIDPLDGFKIVLGLLPPDQAREWAQLKRYGIIFLLILIFPTLAGGSSPLWTLIGPPIRLLINIFIPGTSFI